MQSYQWGRVEDYKAGDGKPPIYHISHPQGSSCAALYGRGPESYYKFDAETLCAQRTLIAKFGVAICEKCTTWLLDATLNPPPAPYVYPTPAQVEEVAEVKRSPMSREIRRRK